MQIGSAIFLGLAGAGPALGQPAAADDIGIAERALGPAPMTSDDIAKMSPATLAEANAGLRDGAAAGIREDGRSLAPGELDVSTEIITVAGHGVLKTRVQIPAKMFYYQFSGVVNGNTVIVVCASKSARPFNPNGTECERRVNAVFGAGERG